MHKERGDSRAAVSKARRRHPRNVIRFLTPRRHPPQLFGTRWTPPVRSPSCRRRSSFRSHPKGRCGLGNIFNKPLKEWIVLLAANNQSRYAVERFALCQTQTAPLRVTAASKGTTEFLEVRANFSLTSSGRDISIYFNADDLPRNVSLWTILL